MIIRSAPKHVDIEAEKQFLKDAAAQTIVDHKRRTRILALDAAAKACSTLFTPVYDGEGGFRTVDSDIAKEHVIAVAKAFEAYLDGPA